MPIAQLLCKTSHALQGGKKWFSKESFSLSFFIAETLTQTAEKIPHQTEKIC